jgi:hypothetical protein
MSQYSKSGFKQRYGTNGTQFPDNNEGLITEAIMRQYGEDLADSFLNNLDDIYKSFLVSTLGTDTYTATPSPILSALVNNFVFFINFSNPNTGPSTLNLNSLGAVDIVKQDATPVAAGDLDGVMLLIYRQTPNHFQIIGGTKSINGGTP